MTPREQLIDIKRAFGLSVAELAELLAIDRHVIYAETDAQVETQVDAQDKARIHWLWEAATLWRTTYNPVAYPPRSLVLKSPRHNGTTPYDTLKQQPGPADLTTLLSELRGLALDHEHIIQQRRARSGKGTLSPEQLRINQRTLGKSVYIEKEEEGTG